MTKIKINLLLLSLSILISFSIFYWCFDKLFVGKDERVVLYGELVNGSIQWSVPNLAQVPFSGQYFRIPPSSVNISSQGLRDKFYEIPKPAGTYRIAVLGDSYTFGWGVEQNDTFVKCLETLLNENSTLDFEVMNFGFPDYNTIQEVGMLKAKALDFEPDFVIINFWPEDISLNKFEWDFFEEKLAKFLEEKHVGFLNTLLKRSDIMDFLKISYFSRHHSDILAEAYCGDAGREVLYQHFNRTLLAIDELNFLSKHYSLPVLFVVLQESYEAFRCEQNFSFYSKKIIGYVQGKGIPVLDLQPSWDGWNESDDLLWIKNDGHFTPLAHRMVADEIYGFLVGNDLVPL